MTSLRLLHVLSLQMNFPAGLSVGEGALANELAIARDGKDREVLRGTSFAGVLRHAWARRQGTSPESPQVTDWFGKPPEGDEPSAPSPLRVPDCLFDIGYHGSTLRNHNAIDRHRGAVADRALFSVEALPPGTTVQCVLVLDKSGLVPEAGEAFCQQIVDLFGSGLLVGGSSARGIGLVELDQAQRWTFDLHDVEELASWLDADYERRRSGDWPLVDGTILRPKLENDDSLVLKLRLRIPRGQDLLISDGLGLEDDSEPQRAVASDGKEYWRLPGSSLRGPLRAWMSRLAARDGHEIGDSIERYRKADGKADSHDVRVGWCGVADRISQRAYQENPEKIKCPIARLFGSLYAQGRIHISDAFAQIVDEKKETQRRMHVAVDRFSGGVNEGLLFSDRVLIAGTEFSLRIMIRNPQPQEVNWLAQSLVALDMGLIRPGASNAAGRLEFAGRATASGPCADLLMQHLDEAKQNS